MPRSDRSAVNGRSLSPSTGRSPWLTVMAATILALPLVCLAVPPELALPTVSLVLLLTGFGVAGGAYLVGQQSLPDRIGARDVAGALVLLGFAAALLSRDEQALALFERLHAGVVASGQM